MTMVRQLNDPIGQCGTLSYGKNEHCLFCGKSCVLEKDPKHSDRWRASFSYKTSDRKTRSVYKESVLSICDERNDEWAAKVWVRLSDTRANHDLHAADARYHDDCRKNFSNHRNIGTARRNNQENEVDVAYAKLLQIIESDKTKMWTSLRSSQIACKRRWFTTIKTTVGGQGSKN